MRPWCESTLGRSGAPAQAGTRSCGKLRSAVDVQLFLSTLEFLFIANRRFLMEALSMKRGSAMKAGLALALSAGIGFAFASSARAEDVGRAILAGIIPDTTLGIIANTPGPYAGPPPPPSSPVSYYAPAIARGPYRLRCWYEPRQVWDGYGFVVRPVRICD